MDVVKRQFMTVLIILLLLNIGLLIGVIIKWNLARKLCNEGIYSRTFPFNISETLPGRRSVWPIREYSCLIDIKVVESDGFSSELHCGGAIIDSVWILTAAHCVDMLLSVTSKNIIVYSGNRLRKISIQHKVIFMTYHKDYNNETWNADVGLIKVRKPFQGNFEKPIAIADNMYEYKVNRTVTAVGTSGDYYEDYYMSHDVTLNVVDVLILNDEYCKEFYKNIGETITNSMFCAGSYTGKKLACHLDSGGPLIDRELLVGIASWARDCGKVDQPVVYTKLSIYKKWILSVLKNN